jgi:hypothetical protein
MLLAGAFLCMYLLQVCGSWGWEMRYHEVFRCMFVHVVYEYKA